MPICLKLKTIIVTNNRSILDTARSVKIIFGEKNTTYQNNNNLWQLLTERNIYWVHTMFFTWWLSDKKIKGWKNSRILFQSYEWYGLLLKFMWNWSEKILCHLILLFFLVFFDCFTYYYWYEYDLEGGVFFNTI